MTSCKDAFEELHVSLTFLQALLAFYGDEKGSSKGQADTTNTAANGILSPMGKMALQTPQKTRSSSSRGHTSTRSQVVFEP